MGLPHAEKRNNAQESISIDRRSLLLGGTTLAAAAAANGPVGSAKAQEQPAAGTGKPPNILVIFGDDIGIPQNSAYTMGGPDGLSHAQHRSYRRRGLDFHRCLWAAELHRRAHPSFSARNSSAWGC